MIEHELTEDELRLIHRDKGQPAPRRAAALRILRAIEGGDLSDFEPWIAGEVDLRALKKMGVNTEVAKKAKVKRRVIPQKDGPPIEEEEREIELHDRSGVDFDRIMDRTEGLPTASVKVEGIIESIRRIEVAYVGAEYIPALATNGTGLLGVGEHAGSPVVDGGGATGDGQVGCDPDGAGEAGDSAPGVQDSPAAEVQSGPDQIDSADA